MAQGFADWHKNGLMIPDSLRNAINVYRNEQDLLEQFSEEECVVGGVDHNPLNLYESIGVELLNFHANSFGETGE